MENTAHSFTEAAEYNPEDAPQKPYDEADIVEEVAQEQAEIG